MKKEFFKEIEIPEGTEANIVENVINVKGSEGEISKQFKSGKFTIEKKDNKIIIGHKRATKKEKKMINTFSAHIKNMLKGVNEKFEYKLKICSSHFPITANIEGDKIVIKNFLGEKISRVAKILLGTDVKIDKDVITINSADKELAGQTAANLETATKVSMRDRRVFQDGIFIINKAGKDI